jgi:AraC-like DNA-binding protein
MVCEQAFISEVREATAALLVGGAAAPIDDVAAALFVSRSTLQRKLAACGTSFTDVRRQAAVRLALARLTSGASCAAAARAVGLSGDHLCRLVTEYAGLRPREIARACELAERARRWKQSTPPRSGTRLYAERIKRWRALEVELKALLAPIAASGHPLSSWAHRVARSSRRPDFRAGTYRRRVRAARSRERAARAAERRRMDEWWAEFRRTRYDPDAGDVDLLQNLDLYVVKALDPVDRARDVVFSDDRIVLT